MKIKNLAVLLVLAGVISWFLSEKLLIENFKLVGIVISLVVIGFGVTLYVASSYLEKRLLRKISNHQVILAREKSSYSQGADKSTEIFKLENALIDLKRRAEKWDLDIPDHSEFINGPQKLT